MEPQIRMTLSSGNKMVIFGNRIIAYTVNVKDSQTYVNIFKSISEKSTYKVSTIEIKTDNMYELKNGDKLYIDNKNIEIIESEDDSIYITAVDGEHFICKK